MGIINSRSNIPVKYKHTTEKFRWEAKKPTEMFPKKKKRSFREEYNKQQRQQALESNLI